VIQINEADLRLLQGSTGFETWGMAMKTLFLCGVAVLGLTLLPATASAAAIGGGAAGRLRAPTVDQSLLIQVQHRPRRGGGHPHRGDRHRDGAGAAAAGAAIGLFLGTMMAVEAQRQQAIEYCTRRYRSYDPYSMTYLGRDGRRHRCP
jgi:hypothetical protein